MTDMDKELIRQLRTAGIQADEMRLRDFGYLMKCAAEAVERLVVYSEFWEDSAQKAKKLLEEKVPKWIPVDERLPEKHKRVFVCTKSKAVGVDFVNADGDWYTTGGVTHWMPLPNPPVKGKEE